MKSSQWSERAKAVIPGGVNSPVRAFKKVGRDPVFFDRGDGPFLYDVEGKRYIDFCASFGPHILGHSPPCVVEALKIQAGKATSFGACHPGEVELAEEILSCLPGMDQLRLVNSGTEAVMTAVRVARGFTGRSKIIQFEGCYHGHSDGLLAKAGSGVAELAESSSQGVPHSVVADTLIAQFNDVSTVEAIFKKHPGEVAALILEPIPANNGLWPPDRGHLERLMEIARSHGALVIFDEVISGFRVSLQGAAGLFHLTPDLMTLGKIIGGGLPLAAVAGKKEILEALAPVGSVYQAGTLSGNPLATAAGLVVVRQLKATSPYGHLEPVTRDFAVELQKLLQPKYNARVRHFASLFWMDFEGDGNFPPTISPEASGRYAEFFGKALEAGVYFAPSPYEVGFVSTAHEWEVLAEALDRIDACLR